MNVFDDIKVGLEQAIEYEKGNLNAKKTTISILPLHKFTSAEIKEIRNKTGLTQVLFAQYMGVSVKTVEAWEAGRNHPDGAACRLLSVTKENPSFPIISGIVAL
ncbi:MAG: helix-turn-helix domain-containing protein [Firmicutes bacterium]|nr:helix-turn-helix domain-containing protein [Bacillota bacterium]